jgi:hypothetical protein
MDGSSLTVAEVGESEEEDGAEPKEPLPAANQPPARSAQHTPGGLRQDDQNTEQREQARQVSDGEHAADARGDTAPWRQRRLSRIPQAFPRDEA